MIHSISVRASRMEKKRIFFLLLRYTIVKGKINGCVLIWNLYSWSIGPCCQNSTERIHRVKVLLKYFFFCFLSPVWRLFCCPTNVRKERQKGRLEQSFISLLDNYNTVGTSTQVAAGPTTILIFFFSLDFLRSDSRLWGWKQKWRKRNEGGTKGERSCLKRTFSSTDEDVDEITQRPFSPGLKR